MNYLKTLRKYTKKNIFLMKDYIVTKLSGKPIGVLQTQNNNESSELPIYQSNYCSKDPIEVVRTQPRLKIQHSEATPHVPAQNDGELHDTKIAKLNTAKSQPRVKWFFKVIAGIDQGRQYLATTPEIKIGRKPENHICLKDPKVSRFHAQIRFEGMNLVIRDLGSTNGTSIDGEKIIQEHRLLSGDMFKVGETIIQIISETW